MYKWDELLQEMELDELNRKLIKIQISNPYMELYNSKYFSIANLLIPYEETGFNE